MKIDNFLTEPKYLIQLKIYKKFFIQDTYKFKKVNDIKQKKV